MSKEARRIRGIVGRLKNREDIAEILRMARLETTIAVFADDRSRFDRALETYEAAKEALANASVHLQPPRYHVAH